MALTLRERNQIFAAINEGGIHPSGFTFEDYAARRPGWPTDVTIRHSATGSAFKISDSQIEWSVTDGPRAQLQSWASWTGLLDAVRDWAREVRYVAETPDYWEELKRIPEILGAAQAGTAGNARFTADEQAEIAHRIEAVKGQTRAMPELTSEQASGIEQKLDELMEASEHVRRKDWITMLYGAAFAMVVNDSIPAHVVQSIMTLLITGVAHMYGLGGMPPSLPYG